MTGTDRPLDEEEFTDSWNQYRRLAYRVAWQSVYGIPVSLRVDIIEDAATDGLWTALRTWNADRDRKRSLKNWVSFVVHRIAIQRSRRWRAATKHTGDLSAASLECAVLDIVDDHDPTASVERDDLWEFLEKNLTPRFRRLIEDVRSGSSIESARVAAGVSWVKTLTDYMNERWEMSQ
jgi:DNA-directed RNA polymerase specialized sigma24 family protein